jgi:hypothetical protein
MLKVKGQLTAGDSSGLFHFETQYLPFYTPLLLKMMFLTRGFLLLKLLES